MTDHHHHSATDADVAERIVRSWRELRRGAAAGALREHLLGVDGASLDQGQLDALEILDGQPDGWRMSEFADALRVDPSTATRAVDRLERHGLAERSVDDQDRRIVIARTTEEGRTALYRIQQLRAIGMERILSSFEPAERDEMARLLERFVAAMDELVAELSPER